MNYEKISREYIKNLILLSLVLVLSLVLRIPYIDSIPPGLHGDEAITGLDASLILEEGSVPIYSGNALGQPTGPLWITAILLKYLGYEIMTIRLSMVFFSILTIIFFYLLIYELFKKTSISFFSTLAFSTSLYHLHFSRIAFMLISAPFFQISSLYFLLKFINSNKYFYLITSAVLLGAGVYSYNSFLAYLGIFLFMLVFFKLLFKKKFFFTNKNLIIFISLVLLTASPLLKIAITQSDFYFQHHRTVSILNKPELKSNITLTGKLQEFFSNGLTNLKVFYAGHKVDTVDGFGTLFSFNPVYLFILLASILAILVNSRKKHYFLLFLLFLFLFQNLVFFLFFDGIYRRGVVLISFIFLFYAFFFSNIKKPLGRYILIISQSAVAMINVFFYFKIFPELSSSRFTFAYELKQTADVIKSIEKSDVNLLFYSSRWSCNYESLRFMLIKNPYKCIDASEEFGKKTDLGKKDLPANFVIVLLDKYIAKKTDFEKNFSTTIKLPQNAGYILYNQ